MFRYNDANNTSQILAECTSSIGAHPAFTWDTFAVNAGCTQATFMVHLRSMLRVYVKAHAGIPLQSVQGLFRIFLGPAQIRLRACSDLSQEAHLWSI